MDPGLSVICLAKISFALLKRLASVQKSPFRTVGHRFRRYFISLFLARIRLRLSKKLLLNRNVFSKILNEMFLIRTMFLTGKNFFYSKLRAFL